MEDARQLYEDILQTANKFLRNAQQFEVSVLQDRDPSYEELASIMRKLASLIHDTLDEIDPMLAHQALEYTTFMEKMALAINQDEQERLNELTAELDKKPFFSAI